ncbi:hypothetical protein ACFLQU_03135 [Verrucomicrobiota bacterium]
MNTPILLIVFNRSHAARQALNCIRGGAPERLYVAADGPRPSQPGETELCEQTRAVLDDIDWKCDVETLFRNENMGCKHGVSSAIDWFFEREKEGIILEDDCLPDVSFFRYCEELLERHRGQDRVMTINGSNFQFGQKRGGASYFFSRCPHVWGWATWRRAWQHFDLGMASFPELSRSDRFYRAFPNRRMRRHYSILMRAAFEGRIDSWAYPLLYSVLAHDGLCINPNTNLVENIGWTSGTHTAMQNVNWIKRVTMSNIYRRLANNKAQPIPFPLTHPSRIEPDPHADLRHFRLCLDNPFMWLHVRLKFGWH